MEEILDTLVIGGGQAGLASGYYLKSKHLSFTILEAQDGHTGSWSQYYDSLKLFSPTRFSSLPGLNIPGKADYYPLKNEVIDYLHSYAKHFELPILTNQRVMNIERKKEHFEVITSSGDRFHTRSIICATGSFQNPYKPVIKDKETFKGTIIHSSEYRKPDSFVGQRVIVVGRGNSAVQIAIELAEVSKVTLAVKQPVHLMKQKFWGIDVHYWLRWSGLDVFPFWRLGKRAPGSSSVIDLNDYKKRLASQIPDQQPMFEAFYSDGVVWLDGTREPVDAVILATGYRADYDYLKDIGALHSNGEPIQSTGVSLSVPGLYFVGLDGQRSISSATLRGVGPDAKFVVKRLSRYLQHSR